MFTKIYRKLSIGIIIFIVLIVAIENIIIFISFKKITYSNFKDSVNESCRLAYNNFDSYTSLMTSYVENTISKETFFDDVVNHRYSLNSLKIPSLNILGITLYTSDNIYYSDGMGGIVHLNTLKSDESFNAFAENDESCYIFIRSDAKLINNNYITNVKFDKSYGVISYIWKIYNSSEVKGYLFVDLNIKEIYNTFFSFNGFDEMRNSKTYIKSSSNYYLCLNEVLSLNDISKNKALVNENSSSSFEILTLTPVKNYHQETLMVYLPILIVSLFIVTIGIIFSCKYSKNISTSLANLNNQMKCIDKTLEERLSK